MGAKVFMTPKNSPDRVVPVDAFWVDHKLAQGWKKVTRAKAEKIAEAASTDPTRTDEKGKSRG